MIKISRNNQIIFYIIALVFVIYFFFYFYRQASIVEEDFLGVRPGSVQLKSSLSKEDAEIDIKLFISEKFRDLRSEVAPIQSFETGKRNPFESY